MLKAKAGKPTFTQAVYIAISNTKYSRGLYLGISESNYYVSKFGEK